jgi:DNA-binding MarR family transcriptional regulator
MIIVTNVTINPKIAMPPNKSEFKLDEFLPFRLMSAAEIMSLQFAERYRQKYAMTRPEWRTFAIAGEHKGITAKEVGAISGMHKTKISRAVGSLEKRGWVTRQRDTQDKRIEHIKLTAKGRTHYAILVNEANEFSDALSQKLGPKAMATIWKAIALLDKDKC